MSLALQLARQGKYLTSPNPRVGCVIARPDPDNLSNLRVIGQGWHRRFGGLHAEREALDDCSEDPRGATLYVTLEPCVHQGKTPPCSDAILQAGIARVVVATRDPFPLVDGKGLERLRENGVQVEVGLLEEEARYENRFFFHRHETGLPWVILKTAMSLDGKCATASGDSKWITGEEAREYAHEGRAEADAILCGLGTVHSDNPTLTARPRNLSQDEFRQPVRVILDPMLDIPLECNLLQTLDRAPLWLFCSKQASLEKRRILEERGARVYRIPANGPNLVVLEVLRRLADENLLCVWVEGGPRIHTALLESNLVNEIRVFVAPVLIGGKDAPSFYMGLGAATMINSRRLQRVQRRFLGADTLIQGILNWRLKAPDDER